MKKRAKIITVLFSAILLSITQGANAQSYEFTIKGNPIITHKFTSDPATLVHDGKLYIYTGHDAPQRFGLNNPQEWLVFSSGDLRSWQEHPVPLKKNDFEWAANENNTWAWAPHAIEKNGKFYMYVTIGNPVKQANQIGVAVADNPAGPFKDAIGKPLVSANLTSIDPAVFIDDDMQAYIFWGGYGKCFYAKLKENMVELDSPAISIDIEGSFFAGSWVHKHGDWYYLSYSKGFPSKIVYSMSKSINGPWECKGIINEIAGNSDTNQHAITDFNGKSYFFYHNGALPGGGPGSRSVCVDDIYYNPDGTMKKVWMTSEGILK
ncbi:MAG: family 43 glycosylhydrolase [Prevotella sp.]|nr:family 43 glycosylhydrolase [Prevotella sp.]